jgi:hypothetical protein
LKEAIRYREHEIESIKRLRWISRNDSEEVKKFVLHGYGISDLSDRMDLLAILYHDIGNLDHAITILRKSKALCQRHGITFDSQDLLDDYREERAELVETNGKKPRSYTPPHRRARQH